MSLFKGCLQVSVSEQCLTISFYAWILPRSGCAFGMICKSFCRFFVCLFVLQNCKSYKMPYMLPLWVVGTGSQWQLRFVALQRASHSYASWNRTLSKWIRPECLYSLTTVMTWEEADAEWLGLARFALRASRRDMAGKFRTLLMSAQTFFRQSLIKVWRYTTIPVLIWPIFWIAIKHSTSLDKWYPGSVDFSGRLDFIWELHSWFFVTDRRIFTQSVKIYCLSTLCHGLWQVIEIERLRRYCPCLLEAFNLDIGGKNRRTWSGLPCCSNICYPLICAHVPKATAHLMAKIIVGGEIQSCMRPKTDREAKWSKW